LNTRPAESPLRAGRLCFMTDYPKNELARLQESIQRSLQVLLDAIRARLPQLEELLRLIGYDYEDRLYRFYYHSFKVYYLQATTARAA
jgi:Lon protease-like protein